MKNLDVEKKMFQIITFLQHSTGRNRWKMSVYELRFELKDLQNIIKVFTTNSSSR